VGVRNSGLGVEGKFVKEISMDSAQGGSFGLAVETLGNTAKFAAVDEAANLFPIWTLTLREWGSKRE
jgi:hypothetical protein